MESSGTVAALLIALFTLLLGFLIFRSIFDLGTLEVRARLRGRRDATRSRFRRRRRVLLLALLIPAAVCALAYAALRFAPAAVAAMQDLLAGGTAQDPAAEDERLVQRRPPAPRAIVADHSVVDEVRLGRIPPPDLQEAAKRLRILFVHGTHGAQITYGLKALVEFKGPAYAGPPIEALEFADRSEPDLDAWAQRARSYLSERGNQDVNVVMWLWSDELSQASEQEVAAYLALTEELQREFPEVSFIYTTGHLDGSGPGGNLRQRNEQIRRFCRENARVLYDFADIESWDPDGSYYGDRPLNDGCWYDGDGDGSLDRNWAKDWSESNPGAWYDCYSPHTFPLNANLKAYAAWWLWVRLAERGQPNGTR